MTSRPSPTPPPVVHALLTASGGSVRGEQQGDAFELGVDERERLYVVLVSVEGAGHEAGRVMQATLDLVRAGAPLQRIVAAAEAAGVGLQHGVGLTLLRFDQPGSRVELLNAGMAPVACLLPGARALQYPARSAAVGRGFRQVHPYELLPLVWGSVWVVVSPGLAGVRVERSAEGGRRDHADEASLFALLDTPALREPGRIANGSSDSARGAVESLLRGRPQPTRDASLIVVDSSRRSRVVHKSIPETDGPV